MEWLGHPCLVCRVRSPHRYCAKHTVLDLKKRMNRSRTARKHVCSRCKTLTWNGRGICTKCLDLLPGILDHKPPKKAKRDNT